jgi:hypothetical protein
MMRSSQATKWGIALPYKIEYTSSVVQDLKKLGASVAGDTSGQGGKQC